MNKHGLRIGDKALRKNSNDKWVKFIVNQTYLLLIDEFPKDYRRLTTEIKLDKRTLPKDGQWCEYDTHEQYEIVGYYDEEENAFLEYGKELPKTAFDVHFWELLKIEWELDYWTEQGEGLAAIKGIDRFGNGYLAGGKYEGGTLESVEDIEMITKIESNWIPLQN